MRLGRSNLLLALAALVSTILAIEIAVRVVGLPPGVGRLIDLYGAPVSEMGGVDLWEAPEFYRRYPSGEIERIARSAKPTIVGLGDSIMFGVNLATEQTYLEQVRRVLRAGGQDVEVLNLAVPGYNTAQENAVHRRVGDALRPELTIVHYWSDDGRSYRVAAGHVVDLGDMLDGDDRIQVLPLPASWNDALLVHSRIYALLTHVLVERSREARPSDFNRVVLPLTEMQRRSEELGGQLLVLASPGFESDRIIPNRELPELRALAEREGFEVVDLADWLAGSTAESVAMDSCHFNAEGHRLIGERLAAYVGTVYAPSWSGDVRRSRRQVSPHSS